MNNRNVGFLCSSNKTVVQNMLFEARCSCVKKPNITNVIVVVVVVVDNNRRKGGKYKPGRLKIKHSSAAPAAAVQCTHSALLHIHETQQEQNKKKITKITRNMISTVFYKHSNCNS